MVIEFQEGVMKAEGAEITRELFNLAEAYGSSSP